jgi:hypothetical protein
MDRMTGVLMASIKPASESNTDDQLARIRVNGACSLLDGG